MDSVRYSGLSHYHIFYNLGKKQQEYVLNDLGSKMATTNNLIPENANDGKLGVGEFWGKGDKFYGLDANQDGKITQKEIDDARARLPK